MGLILYLYLGLVILISIIGFILLFFQIIIKGFNFKEILFGFLLSFFLYILTAVGFYLFEEVYAFSSYFVFPFILIILPFLLGVISLLIKLNIKIYLPLVMLYCVFSSSIFIVCFPNYTLDFVITQNLNKTF